MKGLIPEMNMNILSIEKRVKVLTLLTEGNSIRAIERITGVTTKTIMSLLLNAGNKAKIILDQEIRNINSRFLQVDEIWTFVYKKQKNLTPSEKKKGEYGDKYIYVAIDADTKLAPLHLVGARTDKDAKRFMRELNNRLSEGTKNRFQLTTDGFQAYRDAVYLAFENVDYAQIFKNWYREDVEDRKYSPPALESITVNPISGNPNPAYASTSFVERQNLTMRMQMRRMTRLSNGYSRKLVYLEAAVALHFFWYNFLKIHSSLRMTPAMKANITHRIWSWEDFLDYDEFYRMAA
ncbi:MAG TPA: IS1 family transposase [Candidatus Kapabacteria bacterium]|nr:IS1 family transposase [Candidatus Kapabacteria bacterium]